MCAINGFTWEDASLGARMNAVTAHRGPDGSSVVVAPGITLAHNRLAIIDLSVQAGQPMSDQSGRYVIVFNGEIYNYRELRRELVDYPFKTEGDTEVILAAYCAWGIEAFRRLNGIFSIALWDKERERLTLVRDPAGIKPLYYWHTGDRIVFSSEIKALIRAGMPRTLNQPALSHYLRLMYVPEPATLFASAKKLERGHILTFEKGSIANTRYAEVISDPVVSDSYPDQVRMVRRKVEEAVARQLVSDRPIGVYLSGGIDSSSILAAAAAVHPNIDTYSVGYALHDEEEAEKFNADMTLAGQTAAHFGSTHHEFLLTPETAAALVADTVRHLDEPIGNATAVAQLFLAREAKKTVTVVLSGEGGDELFGGYERYRLAHLAARLAPLIPRWAERYDGRARAARLKGVSRFTQLMFQSESEARAVYPSMADMSATSELFNDAFTGGDIVRELMVADEAGWLVDEALMRADKTSMASAVEVRVPLLDKEVVAYAHRLPRTSLVTPFATKRVLKDAFRDVLPKVVLHQPKRGWFSPGAKWLRHPSFVTLCDEVFTKEYVPGIVELFDIEGIRSLLQEHRERRGYHFTQLWALLTLFVWAHEYDVEL